MLILAQMPNKKAKERKYTKRKAREAIKAYRRAKKLGRKHAKGW